MLKLHPKIQELRNKIGYKPIYTFIPNRKKYEGAPKEYRSPVVEDENDEKESRLIKQYFCIFGIPDDYGTVPMKGCFSKSIKERGPNSKASYQITVLWQHKQDDPLCRPTVLKENEIGLYAEYEPDDVPSGNRCVTQVRSGTINQGSYGFNYVWDKMKYDEKTGLIYMYEVELFEISPVTIGAQTETFVVRNSQGEYVDEFLEDETEDLIKQLPRKFHLEIRSIISRHISLAKIQPIEQSRKSLKDGKPEQRKIDYDYLTKKI